jgi:hypothetical protein
MTPFGSGIASALIINAPLLVVIWGIAVPSALLYERKDRINMLSSILPQVWGIIIGFELLLVDLTLVFASVVLFRSNDDMLHAFVWLFYVPLGIVILMIATIVLIVTAFTVAKGCGAVPLVLLPSSKTEK